MPAETAAGGDDPAPASMTGVSRSRHGEMLVISCLALGAAFLLAVGPGDRVHVAGLPQLPVPKLCLTRDLFGVDCPGCGLTRSFVHLARWDWRGAWDVHRLGWLVFLATMMQIPYRIQALVSGNGGIVPVSLAKSFGTALVWLLVLNWLGGLVFVNAWRGN